MAQETKIALGGGCHWCTEAVFQSLKGVILVEQGYVASTKEFNTFSEAVIVHFNEELISLETLIEIHLHTHESTSNHSMRDKYRSAIYTFSNEQSIEAKTVLQRLQSEFKENLVTRILEFSKFEESRPEIQNYYQKNYDKPFCESYVNPKLKLLLNKFTKYVNKDFVQTV